MTSQCDAIRDNLGAYQKGEVTSQERSQIAAHLSDCPGCRREAVAQQQMQAQLRALRRTSEGIEPAPQIWKNVMQACNRYDAARRVRVQLRYALVGACLFLFAFGAVWARLNRTVDFPRAAVINSYSVGMRTGNLPAFQTEDADTAAKWLSERLGGAHIPAIGLHVEDMKLLGAEMLPQTSPATGRLVYQQKSTGRIVACYMTPHGTSFQGFSSASADHGYSFRQYVASDKNVGLICWQNKGIGYGMVLELPVESGYNLATSAMEDTGR